MNASEPGPLKQVGSCCNVAEHHDPVAPTCAPELRPGLVLDGRFVIGEPISRSGMATIYKAHDLHDRETVAVKVPHLRCEADPAFFARFQREEEIGRCLNHRFLLRFVPVDGAKSRPYLVTEYLRGCTLAHLLESRRPLPEADALRIASLLCEALSYLHRQGVVHRDLKPPNIMVCCDGSLRLLDFGIASAVAARRITLTRFASTIGTPDYMAPEQVRRQRTDERTDLYALGTVLYEMLTGSVPFQNENPWVALNDRVTGDPPAPRQLNPILTPQAEEIVLHALQREPAARYPSAAAMQRDLDAPERVVVSGYRDRLQAPRRRIGLHETPFLAGTLMGVGFLCLQVVLFLVLRHHLATK